MILRLFGLRNFVILLFEQRGLFVQLGHVVDLAGEFVQAILKNFVGDLFFIEGHDFFNRAHALFQVLAHGQQFADHNGRSRQRLEHAQLSAFNPLSDFDFAFAGQQRYSSHLA